MPDSLKYPVFEITFPSTQPWGKTVYIPSLSFGEMGPHGVIKEAKDPVDFVCQRCLSHVHANQRRVLLPPLGHIPAATSTERAM